MSHEFYRVLHILGILMLFGGLTSLWGVYVSGQVPKQGLRVGLAVIHGVGMTFLLLSGFAMAGQLGLMSAIPGWMWIKLGLWLALGGSMVLAKRKAHLGVSLVGLWIALGTVAAFLAIYKP